MSVSSSPRSPERLAKIQGLEAAALAIITPLAWSLTYSKIVTGFILNITVQIYRNVRISESKLFNILIAGMPACHFFFLGTGVEGKH